MRTIQNLNSFFLRYLKYTVLCLFLLTNIQAFPNTLNTVFPLIVSEVIREKYTLKNMEILNNLIKQNSLEDLITLAEQSNQESQKILFFLYYAIKSNKILQWEDNRSIIITSDNLSKIETMIKTTNTPEAWFVWGFCQAKFGSYTEGMAYLNKAKEAGHSLAYLVIPAFIINTQQKSEMFLNENIKMIHQTLKEMESKNITSLGFNTLMGILFYAQNKYNKAKEQFTKVIKHNNIFFNPAHTYLGMIYYKENNYELAKKYLLIGIEAGNDTTKPKLLDIYFKESNYSAAFKLLREMALNWGKYTDVASIKASFLLSDILANGLGVSADLIQSYVWATRARIIYDISRDHRVTKYVDSETGRYVLLNFTEPNYKINILDAIINNNKVYLVESQKTEEPVDVFSLMDLKKYDPYINQKQIQAIRQKITTLTEKLIQIKKLHTAHFQADARFKDLHLPVSRCEQNFLH